MSGSRKFQFAALSVVVVIVGLCASAFTIQRWLAPPEIRKPEVILSIAPQSREEAKEGCPIPLPASASNVQYAVWSFGEVQQSWIRFEAPVADCLAHAENLVQPFRSREGYTVTTNPIPEDTGVLCVLDPTEVDLSWFENCQDSTGPIYRVAGGRAPVIWVDTQRGVLYCEVKNECHSLSPP
jgi:hypothetical protein